MPDHPFNGTWTSYGVSTIFAAPFEDGTIELNISPDGQFNSGWHVRASARTSLTLLSLDRTVIHLVEAAYPFCRYYGFMVTRPSAAKSICLGEFHIPARATKLNSKKKRPTDPGQDDGGWVATKP